ncbi:MAG: 4-amino-4-deoxy-L-arabinose transferase-like glycosyltransferase, partial [Candidatus Omnitrophota bacterium]
MLVLLLPISFILLFLTINYYYNNIFTQKREQFVVAAVMCGFLVTFSIELLNVFKCITLVGLSCFWVLIDIVLVYILINKKGSFRLDTPVKFTGVQKFQLSGIIFILACVALIAFIAPPNNWDSLTYHMSRVAHWSQNKAVDFYPTQVYRQNEYAPWAEYVITQVYILQDSDRLVNFVQWFSLFLCTIGVSSIAKLLGQRREVQLMAAFFCVTIPMAILQGSSTQNDLVVSFWLVSATIFLLRWVKYHKNIDCVLFGLTIAHACLTKGSGVLFGSVLIASFILITIRRSFKTMGVKVVMIVSIIIVINAPFNMRLYHQSQTIFSKGDRAKSINEIYSPQALLSNITRNAGLHMTSSFKGLNELMESSIVRLHKVLDLDILDKRLSYGGSEYKIAESMHEDTAGNVLHFWMIFFCFIILIFIRSKDAILIKKYVLIPVLMGFVFVLLLRWNPFHSRYHLPIFILLAPLMAYVVTRWHHIFTLVMSMLCFGLVMPAVFQNTSR